MITRGGRWPGRIAELAVRVLPPGRRQRYAREFVAELHGMPARRQWRHATSLLLHAWALRATLASDPTTDRETIMTATTKPLRCRLGQHDWDKRENPETRERYEICLRCDAYRDRPGAAPGAGAAGVTGSGIA